MQFWPIPTLKNIDSAHREPSSPLASENTHKLILQPLVLTEHIANLSGGASNVSGWHISIRPNVTVQLIHESLQKCKENFRFALCSGGFGCALL